MAAPKGNQFWKNRSKHGRDKLFATPELLLQAAEEFFQWCDDNPWESTETTTKSGAFSETVVKTKPTARPYTLEGFLLYVKASPSWLRNFKMEQTDKDFLTVIKEIELIIYQNQLEGATVGAFNANIIARKLGLSEKTENININHNSKELTDAEMKELDSKLNEDY